MSTDSAAILAAMQAIIDTGHTFVFGRAAMWNGVQQYQVSVSNTGGVVTRSAFGRSPAEALEQVVVQVVAARLDDKPAPTPPIEDQFSLS